MDRDRTELAARALRLLPTSSTALNRRVVTGRTVPFVNTHVVQWLACGAEIAVFFRHVSELDRHLLALHQTRGDALLHNALKQLLKQVRLLKAAMPVLRERRVMGNL